MTFFLYSVNRTWNILPHVSLELAMYNKYLCGNTGTYMHAMLYSFLLCLLWQPQATISDMIQLDPRVTTTRHFVNAVTSVEVVQCITLKSQADGHNIAAEEITSNTTIHKVFFGHSGQTWEDTERNITELVSQKMLQTECFQYLS